MYKCINGWTKKKMLTRLEKRKFTQKSLQEHSDFQSAYLTPEGNRCGIGMFIPIDHLRIHFTGYMRRLLKEYPTLKSKMPLRLKGLSKLQSIHDEADSDVDVKAEMIKWVKNT